MAVLIATELGGGFGHVALIREVLAALEKLEIKASAAFKDLRAASQMLGPQSDCELFQAPIFSPVREFQRVNSFADILVEAGFGNQHVLTTRLKAWVDLIELLNPTHVIVEHAPTALFAAHAMGIPVVAVASSFILPPVSRPFPVMSPGIRSPETIRLQRERQLHGILARSLSSLGLPAPSDLQQPLAQMPTGLSTYPLLDHYGERSDADYLGIPMKTSGGRHWWPENVPAGPRVFVYATWLAAIEVAIAQLLDQKMQVCAVLNSAPKDAFSGNRFFCRMPGHVDMSEALSESDVFLNHGSAKSVAQAILQGKPTVMIPPWQEQEMFARRATAIGAGIISRPDKAAESVLFCINRLKPTEKLVTLRETMKETDVLNRHVKFLEGALHGGPHTDQPRFPVS